MRSKKTWRIIARLLEAVLLLLVVAFIMFQMPSVQTYAARKACAKLEEKFDAKVHIGALRLLPFRTLVVNDFYIVDTKPSAGIDTVFSAKHISATFTLSGLDFRKKGGVKLDRLRGDGVTMRLVVMEREQWSNNLSAVLRLPETSDIPQEKPDLFMIRKVDLTDFRFTMLLPENEVYEYPGFGINWADLDLVADAHGRNVNYVDSRCSMEVDKLVAREKCGYRLRASGNAITGMGLTEITDFHLKDKWSDFNVARYTMGYERLSDWSEFVDRIVLGGTFEPTVLSFKSLRYFAGKIPDSPISLDIARGSISGPVNDLKISSLKAKDLYSGLDLGADGRLTGICEIPDTRVDLSLHRLAFNMGTIKKLMDAFAPDAEADLSKFAKGVGMNLTGKIAGPINSLKMDCKLFTSAGDVSLLAETDGLIDRNMPLEYDGIITIDDLDIGRMAGIEMVGKTSLHAASKGKLRNDDPVLRVSELNISKLTIKDYAYTDINGKGVLQDGIFDGHIVANDPNANIIFQGAVSVDKSKPLMGKFTMGVHYLDLKKTNIDPRPGMSVVRGDFEEIDLNVINQTLLGYVKANGLLYSDEKGDHQIGDMSVSIRNTQGRYRASLKSSFADFGYDGDISMEKVVKPVIAATVGATLPAVLEGEIPQLEGHNFLAELDLKNTEAVLAPLKKDLSISEDTRLSAELKNSGAFSLTFNSKKIDYEKYKLRDPEFALTSSGGVMKADFTTRKIYLNDTELKNISLRANAQDNEAEAGLHAEIAASEGTSVDLNLGANLIRDVRHDNKFVAIGTIPDSKITIQGDVWEIEQPEIRYSIDSLTVHGLSIINGRQSISADGGYSKTSDQQFAVSLDNFELSTITKLIGNKIDLGGILEGDVRIDMHPGSDTAVEGELTCPDLTVGQHRLGSITASAMLDEEVNDRVLFSLSNTSPSAKDAIRVSRGIFNLSSKRVNANCNISDFDISFAEEFVKDYCSNLQGRLNGVIKVDGYLGREDFLTKGITCPDATLTDGKVTVKPTGVSYDLGGKVKYDGGKLYVRNMTVKDRKGGDAIMTGTLDDLKLSLNKFKVIDKSNNGEMIYGDLAVDGGVNITGVGSETMNVSATIATSGDGDVGLIADFKGAGDKVLLTFAEPVDTTDVDDVIVRAGKDEDRKKMAMKMDCRLLVSPQVRLTAMLDKAASNVISASGNGDIGLRLDGSGNMSLSGDYTINNGQCHFAALSSLLTKDFDIDNGSSVKFEGDPMETELDINASHVLKKVSIGALISDTTAVHTQKKVTCGLKISDKITNPQLGFSIDVDDLDPSTRSLVESELNTEDKVQKQFLALLLTGGFISSEQVGITDNNATNGSNLILKNLTSIMSGQVNSILKRAGVPIDLGLSYQQNEIGKDIYDIAVSTNLLQDRVQVDGSIANRRYSSTSNDEVVGNLDIGVKLDKSGELKFKMFSHSADDYTSFLDNTQRNGVGISYQKEYDSFAEYIKGVFKKKSDSILPEEAPQKTIKITE